MAMGDQNKARPSAAVASLPGDQVGATSNERGPYSSPRFGGDASARAGRAGHGSNQTHPCGIGNDQTPSVVVVEFSPPVDRKRSARGVQKAVEEVVARIWQTGVPTAFKWPLDLRHGRRLCVC